jgi:hypothetical protein
MISISNEGENARTPQLTHQKIVMIESPIQSTLYKDGSPDARGVRRSCFKKYCEDLNAESILSMSLASAKKELAEVGVRGKPPQNPLAYNQKGMVKSYYNFNEGIILDHNLSASESSVERGNSSAHIRIMRSQHYPYSYQT